MMKTLAEKGSPDLLFLLTESGCLLEQQYDLVEAGYQTVRRFAGYDDDRARMRAALAADFDLDVTAGAPMGKAARLALASLITAWESAKEFLGRETQLRTEAKALGVTRMVDILDRTSMKRAVEVLYGRIPPREAPSVDYLSIKLEEVENNDPTASPMDEIASMADKDLTALVPGWDAAGRQQLLRKRPKGELPLNAESFRTTLRVEKNLWLYLQSKFGSRNWLQGLRPSHWETYTDYFLGPKVLLLEVCTPDGAKRCLNPPWPIILSYELECRKSIMRLITEEGISFAAAMELVVKDTELKELAFTSPVAMGGRSPGHPTASHSAAKATTATGKGSHLTNNPNYPARRDSPYQKGTGRGKGGAGKGRGKGRGKGGKGNQLVANTPDGRQICFAYNTAAGCPGCDRVHTCRVRGCGAAHGMHEHVYASAGA